MQESDAEASFSSHDSDEEGASFGVKKFKRESIEDVFEENGSRNGMGSPLHDHEMIDTSVNGSHVDFPRDGKLRLFGIFLTKAIPGRQSGNVTYTSYNSKTFTAIHDERGRIIVTFTKKTCK